MVSTKLFAGKHWRKYNWIFSAKEQKYARRNEKNLRKREITKKIHLSIQRCKKEAKQIA